MRGKVKLLGNAVNAITSFYHNVRKSRPHTYSQEQMISNIRNVKSLVLQITETSGRSIKQDKILDVVSSPIEGIEYKVQSCKIRTIQWYFIYYIANETIYVVNAIHGQNLKSHITEALNSKNHNDTLLDESILRRMKELISYNNKAC